jgi:amylo-alpha-1,6-glucosidase
VPRYEGGVPQRDGSYHQGTVWPWLIGPFVEAWLRVRKNTSEAKAEARSRFLPPLRDHLREAGLNHVSEIATAEFRTPPDLMNTNRITELGGHLIRPNWELARSLSDGRGATRPS